MPKQTKINTNDLPNNIGQTVNIKSANNTELTAQVVALSQDGKSVLMRQNKYWFYHPVAYDSTKTAIVITP